MHADEPEEPPGSVSNQMPEEGEAPHDESEGLNRRPSESEPEADADDEGAAGEGSQSTGQPEGAG
jgi:hypothetical protein